MAEGHEIELKLATPVGGVMLVQPAPPLLVTMIDAAPAPLSPTATHVVELADALGAHDTARTFARGEKDAVVCHCGVVAPAGAALP